MENKIQTEKNNNSTKLGCRFTPAEVRLLELLSTTEGISVSAYFRQAVKQRMLDDMLRRAGHHSTIRSEADMAEASAELEKMLTSFEVDAD